MKFRATYETVTAVGETLSYQPFDYSVIIEASSEGEARNKAAKHACTLRDRRFEPVVQDGVIVGSNWLESTVEAIY